MLLLSAALKDENIFIWSVGESAFTIKQGPAWACMASCTCHLYIQLGQLGSQGFQVGAINLKLPSQTHVLNACPLLSSVLLEGCVTFRIRGLASRSRSMIF